ncbi:LysR family transcriptional regulator [Mycolicibacterium tokaiense]|uniref:Putative LysR family transcriptional regulator n=1 Tax=Mycolicibacterium tokaiense TaxID=39695 RepID=A0A378TFF8_9MYCO|nr:LysR family transcriptional regulator [Mycolicibacterium tokaiense]BBY86608.1 LysR family transcriptional regulator [Mycolicibacterium tokaiense]STZ58887.1 putative LysR family transcriptional regulator [Mycolicibacterium tokaiense]
MSDDGGDTRSLTDLDLPQLRALHALLTERSVTAAAHRLARSQPTLSSSLARLRRHFGDELLTRSGNHYVLTPFAQQIFPLTGVAVAAVDRVFAAEADFEPHRTQREFTIVSSDFGISVMGGLLAARLLRDAPSSRIRFLPPTPAVFGREGDYFRTVDGAFMPDGYLNLARRLDLYTDRWVCVVWSGNSRVKGQLTMADLRELPWVTTSVDPVNRSPAWRQMELLGVVPRVCAIADSFVSMPRLIMGTDAVAMLQSRVAAFAAPRPEFTVLDCPFDVVPLVESFWWHPMYDEDPAHLWLRSVFEEIRTAL